MECTPPYQIPHKSRLSKSILFLMWFLLKIFIAFKYLHNSFLFTSNNRKPTFLRRNMLENNVFCQLNKYCDCLKFLHSRDSIMFLLPFKNMRACDYTIISFCLFMLYSLIYFSIFTWDLDCSPLYDYDILDSFHFGIKNEVWLIYYFVQC